MANSKNKNSINKIVLAYSGGLDTSIILHWLQKEYGCEVITFTADIGQGEEIAPAIARAKELGAAKVYAEDLTEDFVGEYVFPMFRANALYEGEYLLGTSIARPLIAKRLVEIAAETGADAIAHGATGKGNDQVRFELGAYALSPDIKIVSPWRIWDLNSRAALMKYAVNNGIVLDSGSSASTDSSSSDSSSSSSSASSDATPALSMDANLLHISYEGGVLEDPWCEPDDSMWRWSVSPEDAPDTPTIIELGFAAGDLVAIDGAKVSPAQGLALLNKLGGTNGIGRVDLLENRYVGMKSRGAYETPGGTILLKAHRAIESITLDSAVAHLKDDLMPQYAELIYNGYWWSPEREMLQVAIDDSQKNVNGQVRLKLYKGNVIVLGRKSETDSLYDITTATFEDDEGVFSQADAEGFIKLNALRLRVVAQKSKSNSAKSKSNSPNSKSKPQNHTK